MEYASKGVGAGGLTTGIIGTSLGVLNSGLLNGNGLGGLFGGNNCGCSDNMMVNRYEAAQNARIAQLETEVKLRDANTYTDSKLGSLRDYVESKFDKVEHELCDQRTYNAVNTATIGCIGGQVAQLMGLTKTIIPAANICPEPMSMYNSWTAPTTTTGA